ncbi:MAG: hypothetical protein Q9M28_07935 [Mariprofundaceae bacterium]|nr:hypothetical protein [Mariprofundaceae bacterium]
MKKTVYYRLMRMLQSKGLTLKHSMVAALTATVLLAGCGGGGSPATTGSGTAQLGYISGGAMKLFVLSNLTTPIATTTTSTSTNPIDAGSFSFTGANLVANQYYLVEISGGFDIDVNDDGIIDLTTQKALQGKFSALVKGSSLSAGNVRFSAFSDMAYQQNKGSFANLTTPSN